MNQREFTKNIATLILEMVSDGNSPALNDVHRALVAQQDAFKNGFSKDDGIEHISAHQKSLAADIYFVVTNADGSVEIDYECEKTAPLHRKYHDRWVAMGGRPIIEWDKDHYQGYI